jgi:AraC-like DNA-binding protein
MPIERLLPSLDRLPRTIYPRSETLPADSLARGHVHPWAQLSWASSGVLVVTTPQASHLAPPQRAVWVPPGLPHEVTSSSRTEMRSLYIDPAATAFAPAHCRVLSVTPLARELLQAVAALPPEYDADGADGRLVAVLLDQLPGCPRPVFSCPGRPMPGSGPSAGPHRQPGRPPGHGRLGHGVWADGPDPQPAIRGRNRPDFREMASLGPAARRPGQPGRRQGVTATALECGYDSPSAFIAAFREAFGVTPGEFLKHR